MSILAICLSSEDYIYREGEWESERGQNKGVCVAGGVREGGEQHVTSSHTHTHRCPLSLLQSATPRNPGGICTLYSVQKTLHNPMPGIILYQSCHTNFIQWYRQRNNLIKLSYSNVIDLFILSVKNNWFGF